MNKYKINSYEIHKNTFKLQIYAKCFKQLSCRIFLLMIKRNHYTATNCTVSFKSIASQSSLISNSLQRKNKTTLKVYFLKDFLLSNLSLIIMVTTFCVFNLTNNF